MLSDIEIQEIVNNVKHQITLRSSACSEGEFLFESMQDCIEAAALAKSFLAEKTREERSLIIDAYRTAALEYAQSLSEAEFEETGYGTIADKVEKCRVAVEKTFGVEDLNTTFMTGEGGIMSETLIPYGIVGATTPSTNPVSTIINNAIMMVAAGNVVVFAPHPDAKECTAMILRILNDAAARIGSKTPLLFSVKNPSVEKRSILLHHPEISLLNITGGGRFAQEALRHSDKRVIAAGPGNPPVIVDETANIEKAARDIVNGASFENNILCISEKEVFVVRSQGFRLLQCMIEQGAQLIDQKQAERLLGVVTISEEGRYKINPRLIGKDASVLLQLAEIPFTGNPRLIITETNKTHPFVWLELMMPILPVVFVDDAEEAIQCSLTAEQGHHHTAVIHSYNGKVIQRAADLLGTTLFINNGSSLDGVGAGAFGYCSFTIATTTGEGLTRPRTYTRITRRAKKDWVPF